MGLRRKRRLDLRGTDTSFANLTGVTVREATMQGRTVYNGWSERRTSAGDGSSATKHRKGCFLCPVHATGVGRRHRLHGLRKVNPEFRSTSWLFVHDEWVNSAGASFTKQGSSQSECPAGSKSVVDEEY